MINYTVSLDTGLDTDLKDETSVTFNQKASRGLCVDNTQKHSRIANMYIRASTPDLCVN